LTKRLSTNATAATTITTTAITISPYVTESHIFSLSYLITTILINYSNFLIA
jgi:hypothetical protein